MSPPPDHGFSRRSSLKGPAIAGIATTGITARTKAAAGPPKPETLGPGDHEITLLINGKNKQVKVETRTTLVRFVAMNWVARGCLNPDGSPQTEKQRRGLVYDRDRPGIHAQVDLSQFIEEVYASPYATDADHAATNRALAAAGLAVRSVGQ